MSALLRKSTLRLVLLFLASIYLFILAIELMKDGALALVPTAGMLIAPDDLTSSLGIGWLSAYVMMSGSPVAASALTFFDAQLIGRLSTFTMITGSRLGASFIVLLIGFVYLLRRRGGLENLEMGLMSLVVTGSTHLLALAPGLLALNYSVLPSVTLNSESSLLSATDAFVSPIISMFASLLPQWALFLLGLLIIVCSFALFDCCIPKVSLKESRFGQVSRLVYRPAIMFLLGAVITMLSMSVSVSLSILVPLSERGFVRQENVIPYIMGANITTFIDTLLAALLLENADAFAIVLIEILSVAIVSGIILLFCYRFYERTVVGFVGWIIGNPRHLSLSIAPIFIVPILLVIF